MLQIFCSPSGRFRAGGRVGARGRVRAGGHARRRLALPLAGVLSAAALLVLPAIAVADTPSTLTVIGTSDVSDSGLIPNLIQPMFQKAYPQFTFKYIGTASGTAISEAESGAVGASALIVHADTLENQFVAGGYSYEKYGRAIWYNDFVLAGSKADPAGVLAGAPHNIVQAFIDVAAAGIGGHATFVSRGGTPGTTTAEHKIWQLAASQPGLPSGLLLCAVSSTYGGGYTPIAPGNGVTADGQPCPGGGAEPSGTQLPAWYAVTGLTQGPNVQNANACNGYPSGPSSCYVFTDRGTYDYLASGSDPAGTIPNLEIVTRDNSATAPGGAAELINRFRAYTINPSKPGETVNLTAAEDFLNFITSPTVQSAVNGYLATSDPGGPPFHADASPLISAPRLPRLYRAGRPLTVTGTVTNAEPYYPNPAHQPVLIDQVVGQAEIPVASSTTDANGNYRIRFVPPATGSYAVVTPQIAQVEEPTLSPVFGDILSPGASVPAHVVVHSSFRALRAASQGGRALVLGTVSPGTLHFRATVTVFARRGSRGRFHRVAVDRLGTDDANFAVAVALGAGRWQVRASFADRRQVIGSRSPTRSVTIGSASAARVTLRSIAARLGRHGLGRLAVSGRVAPPRGGRVELRAMRTAGGAARFGVVARGRLRAGQTGFTLRTRLRHGSRYVLQLVYLPSGLGPAYSTLRTVYVH